jgi:hypothetical protein
MPITTRPPLSDDEVRARIAAKMRRDRARALVLAALRDEPDGLTSLELRRRLGPELGGGRRRLNRDIGAALRSLKLRQLVHRAEDRWRPGSGDVSKRRHPLVVRGPCPDCGELHVTGRCAA